MKIKITCTDGEYKAGLVYDVPDEKALELIATEKAFEIVEERPVYFQPKYKKVKYDTR